MKNIIKLDDQLYWILKASLYDDAYKQLNWEKIYDLLNNFSTLNSTYRLARNDRTLLTKSFE